MTQEKIEEVLFDISKTLSKIETKLSGVCEVLSNHEHRITTLETNKSANNDNWKNQLLMMLAKCLIIGLTSICVLVGGSSLLSQILPSSNNTSSISEIQK